jgi:prepilin-type N-terminal cleavage/methylation domain-containing protein
MQTERQTGFTLIELMITLVVLVIALSLGVPSFVTWIQNNRLDTTTRSIAGVLKSARSEAITRQGIISVRPGTRATPGNWSNGAHIYTETVANGSAYNVSDTLIKDINANMSGITITDDDSNNIITFTNTGALGAGTTTTITLCQSSGGRGSTVTVNFIGRASINTITCP